MCWVLGIPARQPEEEEQYGTATSVSVDTPLQSIPSTVQQGPLWDGSGIVGISCQYPGAGTGGQSFKAACKDLVGGSEICHEG